jgi:bacterioferritin
LPATAPASWRAKWCSKSGFQAFGGICGTPARSHFLYKPPEYRYHLHARHDTCGRQQQKRLGMKGDLKVVEYLNKALRHELTAVNQYWLHYRLLDNWGYQGLAKKWRKESIEEMQHADRLIARIIFLDGFPNMQTLDSLHIGQTVKEVLERDLQAELAARELYQESATYCHSVKDYVTRDLFEELMHNEEDHIDFLETQLDLVARLGLELYAQHHIGELDKD